jgi:hypothetical protein
VFEQVRERARLPEIVDRHDLDFRVELVRRA